MISIVERTSRMHPPPLSLTVLGRSARRLLRLARRSEVTIVFVTDRAMRALNRRTRGVDRPTDVLAFPLHVRRPFRADPDGVTRLGDLVVSLPTARRAAAKNHVSVTEEVRRLIVHGLLHLVGYNHRYQREAHLMERSAQRLLTAWRP